jgi:hypothetical protein
MARARAEAEREGTLPKVMKEQAKQGRAALPALEKSAEAGGLEVSRGRAEGKVDSHLHGIRIPPEA